jgi:hypothetical protein
MIVNHTDSGRILSRYNADLKLIELHIEGKAFQYMRPYQALLLAQTLLRLVDEHNATQCERVGA